MANHKVLIIEGNEKDLKLFATLLKNKGYKTFGAGNMKEGARVAKKEKPSLILLDMQVYLTEGMWLKDTLKEEPLTRNIPVIAVAYHNMKSHAADGFAGYIIKPLDIQEFIKTVDETIEKGMGGNGKSYAV